MRQNLAQIGVKLNLRPLDRAAFVETVFAKRDFDLNLISYCLGAPNLMSWGYLLNNAQSFLWRAWWLSVFPGFAIVTTVLGLSLVLDRE